MTTRRKGEQTLALQVSTRGSIGSGLEAYAAEKVRAAAKLAPRPVLHARITLTSIDNPSVARPAIAKAGLDMSGRRIRAHVAATTMREAIDELEARLRRRLQVLAEHDQQRRHDTGVGEPGAWRHGDRATERPEYFPRPVEERELVRRKSYALQGLAPADAAVELELLDLDFHLFTNLDTGTDAVVHRRNDGTLELLESGPIQTIEAARERLDLMDEPFVFFVDADTRRGNVLYRRYDGHYGLITPAETEPEPPASGEARHQ